MRLNKGRPEQANLAVLEEDSADAPLASSRTGNGPVILSRPAAGLIPKLGFQPGEPPAVGKGRAQPSFHSQQALGALRSSTQTPGCFPRCPERRLAVCCRLNRRSRWSRWSFSARVAASHLGLVCRWRRHADARMLDMAADHRVRTEAAHGGLTCFRADLRSRPGAPVHRDQTSRRRSSSRSLQARY